MRYKNPDLNAQLKIMHQGRDILPRYHLGCQNLFLTNLCVTVKANIIYYFMPYISKKIRQQNGFRPLYRLCLGICQTTSARPWLRSLPDSH